MTNLFPNELLLEAFRIEFIYKPEATGILLVDAKLGTGGAIFLQVDSHSDLDLIWNLSLGGGLVPCSVLDEALREGQWIDSLEFNVQDPEYKYIVD
jgi:hypothetical protein